MSALLFEHSLHVPRVDQFVNFSFHVVHTFLDTSTTHLENLDPIYCAVLVTHL